MQIYHLENNLQVFGKQVKSFPIGIGEVFHDLIKMFPEDDKRSYYGLSGIDKNNSILYYAAAEERFAGEAEKYNCDTYTIEKGKYLTVTVNDWQKKTNSIKDVFHEMMKDRQADKFKPCVEWYKNDDEMLCMVKKI